MFAPMQHNATLSSKQRAVLLEVARGATVKAASERAGIDRCTYYRWFKQPAFAQALAEARDEFAEALRDQFHELEIVALLTLRMLLSNEETPPAVRLRAALAVLGHGKSAQPLSACLSSLKAAQCDTMQHEIAEHAPEPNGPEACNTMPHDLPNDDALSTVPKPAEDLDTHRESEPEALSAARREIHATQCDTLFEPQQQIPRGAPCPCGSGRKYKRCCGQGSSPIYTTTAA